MCFFHSTKIRSRIMHHNRIKISLTYLLRLERLRGGANVNEEGKKRGLLGCEGRGRFMFMKLSHMWESRVSASDIFFFYF